MSYPGGKNQAGVFQTIINQMPPHRVYIEAFAGGGAILRRKKPAAVNIAIDRDSAAVANLRRELRPTSPAPAGLEDPLRSPLLARPDPRAKNGEAISSSARFVFRAANALTFLRDYPFSGGELVYCDPPYLMETRSSGPVYRFEMSAGDHESLCKLLVGLPCSVMISGYWSRMYARLLKGWRSIDFTAVVRSGAIARETLWMNYPEPVALHDYAYLGDTWRERERIARKRRRWVNRLSAMPLLERRALLAAIGEVW